MVVNPGMPNEYKNETDYRKIHREYLNPRIPKRRVSFKRNPLRRCPSIRNFRAIYRRSEQGIFTTTQRRSVRSNK